MEPDEKNIDELLIDYALGEVDPKDQARVELMLAERPELMREAQALKRMVARMGVSMVAPAPRLVSRTRHAAYEARARRRGWLGVLPAALRRPVTAAAAGLVALALMVALVGPRLWSGDRGETLTPIRQAGTISDELRSFLDSSLDDMRALSRGEDPAVEDLSEPAGQAMLLQKQPLSTPQRAVIADIEAVWRTGYDRVNADGYLSAETIAELKELVTRKGLVERIEALLTQPAGGR